ncbi:MAG: FecR domain-containing protein, partial [Terriglobales bacterium]
MKAARLWWLALVLTMTLHMLVAPRLAAAQDDQDQQEQQDPPTRVARLNYSSGSVSFQPGGEGDWVTAVVNRPLTTGDNLWADQNSRAELHVGSLAIRMNSETSLTFLDLDDRTTQLRLSVGSLILRVRHLDDGDLLEVDTPNVAFTVQRTGEYRIDVNQDGTQTITTVWQGRGEATGGGYSYTVVAGQQATFSGTDQLDHEIGQIAPPDDFDNFAFER